MRRFGVLGAFSGFLAVAAGAFGAHALRAVLSPDRLQVFETGARYQLVHALALVGVALALDRDSIRMWSVAGWLFVVGQFLFSGSLYALATTGARLWGALTPLGGLCLLAAWICFAIGFVIVRRSPST